MINKVVHYVWVGKKTIPNKIKKIIKNNANVLGNKWKYKVWTEKDFDINSNPYTKYWYKKKQWAFVSDYIRAYAIYKEGGFYLDTDVVLTKTLDNFLDFEYVVSRTYIVWNTNSIFGAVKNHKILDTYMNILSHPKIYKKPPRIMSTDIHTYAIREHFKPIDKNVDFIFDRAIILSEDKLQIDLNNGENIAIHEHHDNWKGTSNLSISKWYYNKVKYYNELTNKKLQKFIKNRDLMMIRIKKLIK